MTWAAIDPSSWGARLRDARTAKKWRQVDLAKRVGVSYETVLKWERNQRDPQPENLDALAQLGGAFKTLAAERRATAVAPVNGATRDPALRELKRTVARMADALEALERRVAALENPPGRKGRRAQ